jgi:hypothetical protein
LLPFVTLESGNKKPLTSSWKSLVFSHSNTNTTIHLLLLFYFTLYFILFHLHSCSLHATQLSLFYFIFLIIFHSLVQNRIYRPIKPSIRTNRTFKKGRFGPHYCNCGLRWMVFLGPNPPYPTHCPPLVTVYSFLKTTHNSNMLELW